MSLGCPICPRAFIASYPNRRSCLRFLQLESRCFSLSNEEQAVRFEEQTPRLHLYEVGLSDFTCCHTPLLDLPLCSSLALYIIQGS